MEEQRRETDNPFQPISLDERLSRPVSKPHTPRAPMMMRPGQLYGRMPFYQPAVMNSPMPPQPAAKAEPLLNEQPFVPPESWTQPAPPQPEPAFQPLWQSPSEEWPSAPKTPPEDEIPESQRPMEKDALGVPRYLQRSPSLGETPVFHAAVTGPAAAETPVSAAPEEPTVDVPLWPMTWPAAKTQPEENPAPVTEPTEETVPVPETETLAAAPQTESVAETEPVSAPPLPETETILSAEKEESPASAPRRRSRMARRAAAETARREAVPSEAASEPVSAQTVSVPETPAPISDTPPEPAEIPAPASAAEPEKEKQKDPLPDTPPETPPVMESVLEKPAVEAEEPQTEPETVPPSEPLFSAAPRRAEKISEPEKTNEDEKKPESVPVDASGAAAEEDDWYKVFQQSGPLWDPDVSPMGSELDAFFSDDAPKAEIHWNFNENDPVTPAESPSASETDAPVFYPFEVDSLPPEEEIPPQENPSAPLHGFDRPAAGDASPSADQPFWDMSPISDGFSWQAPLQSTVPETPFRPGQPYQAPPTETSGFSNQARAPEQSPPVSEQPKPIRPFAPKPAPPAEEKKQDKPKKEKLKKEKPPILWGRVAALLAVAAMLLFCLIAGGKILLSLSANEREMAQVRQAYQEQQGQALEQAGVRVDLLPAGETFTPTSTPQVFAAPKTELSQNGTEAADAALPEEENTRTRLRRYPDNPLCNVLDSMKEIHTEYPEVLARLSIPGVLDEYVVQRNNTYYLTHNYRGSLSDGGAVFLDKECAINTPPENLLLRGEGNVDGVSFAPLWQYQSGGIGFAAGACFAQLTTLYEDARYVLFSVIVADSDPAKPGYFDYAAHSTFDTDAQMMEYVQSAVDHSLYRFSVSVEPSDRLLTLATVSSRGNGKCLVLLFRMVREGEATP